MDTVLDANFVCRHASGFHTLPVVSESNRHFEITAPAANGADLFPALPSRLRVTFDLAAGGMTFEWVQGDGSVAARGRLVSDASGFGWVVLRWQMESENLGCPDSCSAHSSSVRALLRRIQNLRPLCDERPRIGLLSDLDLGPARSGEWFPLEVPPDEDFWKWLGREVLEFARMIASRLAADGDPGLRGRVALRLLAGARLGVTPKLEDLLPQGALYEPVAGLLSLRVTFNQVKGFCEFVWTRPTDGALVATGCVRVTGVDQLAWETESASGAQEVVVSTHRRQAIRVQLGQWLKRFRTNRNAFTGAWVRLQPGIRNPEHFEEPPFAPPESSVAWIENNLEAMAEALRFDDTPLGRMMSHLPSEAWDFESHERRLLRKERKRTEEEQRRQETMARLAAERRAREQRQAAERKAVKVSKPAHSAHATRADASVKSAERPLPPLPVRIEFPEPVFQRRPRFR